MEQVFSILSHDTLSNAAVDDRGRLSLRVDVEETSGLNVRRAPSLPASSELDVSFGLIQLSIVE